jgi:hypothetical protein
LKASIQSLYSKWIPRRKQRALCHWQPRCPGRCQLCRVSINLNRRGRGGCDGRRCETGSDRGRVTYYDSSFHRHQGCRIDFKRSSKHNKFKFIVAEVVDLDADALASDDDGQIAAKGTACRCFGDSKLLGWASAATVARLLLRVAALAEEGPLAVGTVPLAAATGEGAWGSGC